MMVWRITLTYLIPGGKIELAHDSYEEWVDRAIDNTLAWGHRIAEPCAGELTGLTAQRVEAD